MEREWIQIDSDGSMGGFSSKSVIVTLRKDGSVSLRGIHDLSTEDLGCFSPSGRNGLRTVTDLDDGLRGVLSSIDADIVAPYELADDLERLAKRWDCVLLAAFAKHLIDEVNAEDEDGV